VPGRPPFQASSPTAAVSLSAQFICRSRARERCRATKQVRRSAAGASRRTVRPSVRSFVGSVAPANANISTPGRASPGGGPAGGGTVLLPVRPTQQLATVITPPPLQWIREAILLRHSCVRATPALGGCPGRLSVPRKSLTTGPAAAAAAAAAAVARSPLPGGAN